MTLLQLKTHPIDGGNPKDYPYAEELKKLIGGEIVEIDGIRPWAEIVELVKRADNIICIDSFLQHLCWDMGKQAIVLWGQGDPEIFGHPENINLLKDKKYLREKQFWLWSQTTRNDEAFVEPEEIIRRMK